MRSSKILCPQNRWENLYFYQKSVVLYQMTVMFCNRFLPKHGDRTVDQMVQAARSGKQNIIEGSAAGMTSSENEIKLLNVARASFKELKEDYCDFIATRKLMLWAPGQKRYNGLLEFCRTHNLIEEYAPFFDKWNAEELANCANTLCHMVDKMMMTHITIKERDYTENGDLRERMTAARRRNGQTQNEEIATLKQKLILLERENTELKLQLTKLEETMSKLDEHSSAVQNSSARNNP